MAAILGKAIAKAGRKAKDVRRAGRNLSEQDLNNQIDIMLGREARANARATAKAAGTPEVQSPLSVLKSQLEADARMQKIVVETRAKQIVHADVTAATDARVIDSVQAARLKRQKVTDRATEAQAAEAKANRSSLLNQIRSEPTDTRVAIKATPDINYNPTQVTRLKRKKAENRAVKAQASESAANRGSLLDQVRSEATSARLAANKDAAMTKAAKQQGITDTLSVVIPAAAAMFGVGVSAMVASDHISAMIKNGKLVDSTGKPIADSELSAAGGEDRLSILQSPDSVNKQITDRLEAVQTVQGSADGSSLTIDGKTIDRAAIQRDHGVTILTKQEAAAQGIDNPNNSDIMYITGGKDIPFAAPVDSKRVAVSSLPKSIGQQTRDIVTLQNTIQQEATARAKEAVMADPNVQIAFGNYANMSDVEKAHMDESVRLLQAKHTKRALTEMGKDPVYAQMLDELQLKQATQKNLIAVQAAAGAAPEDIEAVSKMYPDTAGNPRLQLQMLSSDKNLRKAVTDYEISGKVTGISAQMDKGLRDASINLALRVREDPTGVNKNLAISLIGVGDIAQTNLAKSLESTLAKTALSGTVKEKNAQLHSMYQAEFKKAATVTVGRVLLASSGLSEEISSSILQHGIGVEGADSVIESILGGKKLTKDTAPDVLAALSEFSGKDMRVRQLISNNSLIEGVDLTERDIMPRISAFVNLLHTKVKQVQQEDTLPTIANIFMSGVL